MPGHQSCLGFPEILLRALVLLKSSVLLFYLGSQLDASAALEYILLGLEKPAVEQVIAIFFSGAQICVIPFNIPTGGEIVLITVGVWGQQTISQMG